MALIVIVNFVRELSKHSIGVSKYPWKREVFLLTFELIVLVDEIAFNSILQNLDCRIKLKISDGVLMLTNIQLKFKIPKRIMKKVMEESRKNRKT